MRRLAVILVLVAWVAAGCGASRSVSKGSTASKSKNKGAALLATAKKQIGVKYKFGGKSPSGFDCSGLAWWTHKQHGITIQRSSFKQFSDGKKIKKGNLKPGDLVFFTTYRKGASHVGFYNGKNGFVHAPSSGKKVQTTSMDNPWWKKRYVGARRYW